MKILCLVFLVGVLAVETEGWTRYRFRVPRVRLIRIPVPRIHIPRIRVPRIRVSRIRVPRIRLPTSIRVITDRFKSAYKKACGDPYKSDCGYNLAVRVRDVCKGESCKKNMRSLVVNKIFGKRSIDSEDFNASTLAGQ